MIAPIQFWLLTTDIRNVSELGASVHLTEHDAHKALIAVFDDSFEADQLAEANECLALGEFDGVEQLVAEALSSSNDSFDISATEIPIADEMLAALNGVLAAFKQNVGSAAFFEFVEGNKEIITANAVIAKVGGAK